MSAGARTTWGISASPRSRRWSSRLREGPSRYAPPPLRHRRLGVDGGTRLRIEYGQARSPFEVGHQRGAELGVVWQARLVSRLEQQAHPLEPLRLRETAVEMTGYHVRMPAALLAVRRRPPEHL